MFKFTVKTLLLALLCACSGTVFGQTEQDPNFGNGTTTLVVGASTTVNANQSRAYGELVRNGTVQEFNYENKVGAAFNTTTPFLLIKTEHDDNTADNMAFVWSNGITITSATTGTVKIPHTLGSLLSGYYQIIQVDEYNGANIDGTLTVDAYNPTVGHGGVLCVLVDGTVTFGTNGVIDVSAKGIPGGNGGLGGAAGVTVGSAATGAGGIDLPGVDATPPSNLYPGNTKGEKIINVDLICYPTGEVEGQPGGDGTKKNLGSLPTDPGEPFQNIIDDNTNYSTVTGLGGSLTMGSGGYGGKGGYRGASAGGHGGSGASNGKYTRITTSNSQPEAGIGSNGTNSTAATGFSDADAGDGGNGGTGAGIIFIRGKDFICQIGAVHFKANGTDATDAEDGHGDGGDGGDGGKGADAFCSTNGSKTQLYPAGGNGGRGNGGNGADAGSGGNAGEAGAIWLWHETGSANVPDPSHYQMVHGTSGSKGLGGNKGNNGIQHRATTSEGMSCDCGGDPEPSTKTTGNDCACLENFDKLQGMTADGTTVDGYKKWSDGSGTYCYYNTSTDRLTCFEETTPEPHLTVERTTHCGAFDCAFVEGLFDDLHSFGAPITIAGGEAFWSIGANNYTYDFKSGILGDGNVDCTKDCDAAQQTNNEQLTDPRDGWDGKEGKTRAGQRQPSTGNMVDEDPFPFGTGLTEGAEQPITLYPNPAQHWLGVVGNGLSQGTFVIRNALGQELQVGNFKGQTFKIDIEKLDLGVYLLELSQNGQLSTLPFEKR